MARDSGPSTPTGNAASSLSNRTFTLQPAPPSSTSSSNGQNGSNRSGRAARRLYIASEVLRTCRISASDPLLVAGVLGANELKKRLSLQTKDAVNDKASWKKVPAQSLTVKLTVQCTIEDTGALSGHPGLCLAVLHPVEKPYVPSLATDKIDS